MGKQQGGILRYEDARRLEHKMGVLVDEACQMILKYGTSNRQLSSSIGDVVASGDMSLGLLATPKKLQISSIQVCYLTVPTSPGNLTLDIRVIRGGVYHHSVISSGIDVESLSNGTPKTLTLASGMVLKDDYLYLNINSDNSTVTQGSAGVVTTTYKTC